MKAICLLVVILVAACKPVATSGEPGLVLFTSEAGKFTALLPVSQGVEEYTVGKTLFGEPIECVILHSRLNWAEAVVQYCDLVPGSTGSLPETEILDQARSEILRGIKVKVEAEEETRAQEIFPAVELSGKADLRGLGYDGIFKGRIILAEERIYLILMNVGLENQCDCRHQMDQVVESLHIEPDLSIPFQPTP